MDKSDLLMLPGPTNVPPQVTAAMLKPIINHRGPEFHKLYSRIVENAKLVFQTKSDVFVLTASGTGGVECGIRNMTAPGTKIIVPVNGVFSERLAIAVDFSSGKSVRVPVDWGDVVQPEEVKRTLDQNPDATAVAVVYNETSTGACLRTMREIGGICRDRGVLFVVDAISILGGGELPVDDWNVDICITASQKCLMCPPGMALISVSEKAWKIIEKIPRPYYFDLIAMREFAQHNETPFTPAVPLYYALDEALKMIREEGMAPRIARHKSCADAMYAGVESLGLKPFPKDSCRSSVVVGINYPKGLDDKKFREHMREKYHVIVAGAMGKLKGSMFRIGVMGMVTDFEILSTLSAVECVLQDLGLGPRKKVAVEVARGAFAKAF